MLIEKFEGFVRMRKPPPLSLSFRKFKEPQSKELLGVEGPYVYSFYKIRSGSENLVRVSRENIMIPNTSEMVTYFNNIIVNFSHFSYTTPFIYFLANPILEGECSLIKLDRRNGKYRKYRLHNGITFNSFNIAYSVMKEGDDTLFLCAKAVVQSRANIIRRCEIFVDEENGSFSTESRDLVDSASVTAHFRDALASFVFHPQKAPLIIVNREGQFLVYNTASTIFEPWKCSSNSDLDLVVMESVAAEWDSISYNNCPIRRTGSAASQFSVMDRGPFVLFRFRDRSKANPTRANSVRHDILYRLHLDFQKKEYTLRQFQCISYSVELSLYHAFNERYCTVLEKFGEWQLFFMLNTPTLSEMALWSLEYKEVSETGVGIPEEEVKKWIGRQDQGALLSS